MSNYNEYLEFCKKGNLNPMEEKNLRDFNKKKENEKEENKVRVCEVLNPIKDLELPVKAAEGLKDLVNKYVEFANDKKYKPIEKPNEVKIKKDLDTLLFLLSL